MQIKVKHIRLVPAVLLLAGLSLSLVVIRFAKPNQSSLAATHSPRAASALRCVARTGSESSKSGPPFEVLVNSVAGPSKTDSPPERTDLPGRKAWEVVQTSCGETIA